MFLKIIQNFIKRSLLFFPAFGHTAATAQHNFLLNSSFEDINTCSEYNSECGVEGWFYMQDVKVQMIASDTAYGSSGNNTLGIFYNWVGYTGFSPVIGTILPCNLQKGSRYTFKGVLSVKLSNKLIYKPGIVMGERFYVPRRPFSANLHPDSITDIQQIGRTSFYRFSYPYTATGTERYLTFGSFIEEDTSHGKKPSNGREKEMVSLTIDNFELVPDNPFETVCLDFEKNKQAIYNYNFRHKEMDYSLYGKGDLGIRFSTIDSNLVSRMDYPVKEKQVPRTDTLLLGDIFFDFNRYSIKPTAIKLLTGFFTNENTRTVDSIHIEGHTDSIGSDENNMKLSLQRCESVKAWFLNNGIVEETRIRVQGYGESRPVAANNTPEGRALNRRVEIILFHKPSED